MKYTIFITTFVAAMINGCANSETNYMVDLKKSYTYTRSSLKEGSSIELIEVPIVVERVKNNVESLRNSLVEPFVIDGKSTLNDKQVRLFVNEDDGSLWSYFSVGDILTLQVSSKGDLIAIKEIPPLNRDTSSEKGGSVQEVLKKYDKADNVPNPANIPFEELREN